MKIGMMQPYFFPYLGYFSLIDYCDLFVFFDTAQYIRHGWINRNRILNQEGKPMYFGIPIIKMSQSARINEMVINENENWRDEILGKITVYKKKAPYYDRVRELICDVINFPNGTLSVSTVAINSIIKICEYIGIENNFKIFSEMQMGITNVRASDEWALKVTKAMGGDIYANLPGGKEFFCKSKYEAENVKLQFIENELRPYIQKIGHFEPGLSIIDVIMFNDKNEVRKLVSEYKIS